MTEAEWLAAKNPVGMLEFLHGKASERKLALFACACCRRVGHLLPGEWQRAFAAVERYAEGVIKARTVRKWLRGLATARLRQIEPYSPQWSACVAVEESMSSNLVLRPEQCSHYAARAVVTTVSHSAGSEAWMTAFRVEQAFQCQIMHDICGPLCIRPVRLNSAWITPTAIQMAEAAYVERVFDSLPVLADALEEAGCPEIKLLEHLRGPGPHVRGCWVLDALLDNSSTC